jgi:hypothetical protein
MARCSARTGRSALSTADSCYDQRRGAAGRVTGVKSVYPAKGDGAAAPRDQHLTIHPLLGDFGKRTYTSALPPVCSLKEYTASEVLIGLAPRHLSH